MSITLSVHKRYLPLHFDNCDLTDTYTDSASTTNTATTSTYDTTASTLDDSSGIYVSRSYELITRIHFKVKLISKGHNSHLYLIDQIYNLTRESFPTPTPTPTTVSAHASSSSATDKHKLDDTNHNNIATTNTAASTCPCTTIRGSAVECESKGDASAVEEEEGEGEVITDRVYSRTINSDPSGGVTIEYSHRYKTPNIIIIQPLSPLPPSSSIPFPTSDSSVYLESNSSIPNATAICSSQTMLHVDNQDVPYTSLIPQSGGRGSHGDGGNKLTVTVNKHATQTS